MELTDRKKQILKIVVESYINTAEPVGSKAIVEQMPGKISSATIRNELADLVEMGYLEQPHTSAGRVPSAKGYRLYVNELMERKALSPEETAKINDALSGQMKQVDQVISQAGQMVSSFVGYPTYAVADHRTVATVQRFELISVSESSFIAVVMLSDNRVKSQLMQLHPHAVLAVAGDEAVVLLGGEAGHGLKPVGVVGGALFNGPVLHRAGDLAGYGTIQRRSLCQ